MSHEIEIESTLKETRRFKPDAAWAKRANVAGQAAYKRMAAEGAKNPARFWARMAKEHVSWFSTWKKVLDWKPPHAKWFVGAKTNVSYSSPFRPARCFGAWHLSRTCR